MTDFDKNVFLNCPFDPEYLPLFNSIVFAVHKCGFVLRSAKEFEDSSSIRMHNILKLIGESKYSIHDLSRIGFSNDDEPLPRFNMPLELGCAIGCKMFGNKQQRKIEYIVLVSRPHQFQKFISDISGQDPKAHSDSPFDTIKCVRDWLSGKVSPKTVPSATNIYQEYLNFEDALPELCKGADWLPTELTFVEYRALIANWLASEEED
jgi:hypothetical protein